MDIAQSLNCAIVSIEETQRIIALNEHLLRGVSNDVQRILGLTDYSLRLHDVVSLLDLRNSSKNILQGYKDAQANREVLHDNVKIPFSHARLFSIQAFISCTWSIYDITNSICSCMLCGKPIAVADQKKNSHLKKIFLEAKGTNSQSSPNIIVSTLTNINDLEIEYFYTVLNIFIHSAGNETRESFIEDTAGKDCFELSQAALDAINEKMDQDIKSRHSQDALLRQTDLLIIFDHCLKKVDDVFCLLLDTSTVLYNSLIKNLVLMKGGGVT